MRVTDSIRRGKSVLTSSIGTEAVCCQAAVKNLMVHSSPTPMSVRKKTNTIFFFRVKDNRTEPNEAEAEPKNKFVVRFAVASNGMRCIEIPT